MIKRTPATLSALLLALLATILIPAAVTATPGDDEAATEDIVHMLDGRVLHGQIVEETRSTIVFELVDRASGIGAKITLLMDEIAEIQRDVALEEKSDAAEPATPKRASPASQPDRLSTDRTYGALRSTSDDESLPSFYFVPMKGQMGTDVLAQVYEEMVDDIRAADPDHLIIEMECRDNEDVLYSLMGREETGLADFDEFRKLINLFRDDLGDIHQVVWIHDSVGVSSAVAMVWPEFYMTPTARFGGLVAARDQTGFDKWSDDDVRGKMTAAFMSWVKGFLEYGGYDLMLADAMVRPEFSLSGTWKGREVVWTLDTDGEYIVDQNDKATANFRAKTAEDLCLSQGTAETVDDLALLLGIREYRVLDGKADSLFEDYRTGWRRAKDNCVEWLQDYEEYMGWAGGADALKYLGAAKGRLEKVVAAMDRYKAVETRMNMEFGIKKFDLETQIEVLKERIRALKRGGRGGGRGGGGGGVGGRGGGG